MVKRTEPWQETIVSTMEEMKDEIYDFGDRNAENGMD